MKKFFVDIVAPCLLIGLGLFIGASNVVVTLGKWEAEEQAAYLVEDLAKCEDYNREIVEESIKTARLAQQCVEKYKELRARVNK